MINPISFRAGVAPIVMDAPTKPEETKTEVVTAPVETAASFKGADALAAYNKAILAADDNAEVKAPAFKGEEVDETEAKAPAFKGEEVAETEVKTPAFKGEEVPAEDAEVEKDAEKAEA